MTQNIKLSKIELKEIANFYLKKSDEYIKPIKKARANYKKDSSIENLNKICQLVNLSNIYYSQYMKFEKLYKITK